MTTTSAGAALTTDAMALLQAGRLGEAEQLFRQAFALDPQNALALLGLGVIEHRGGNFAAALALFDRCILIAPALAAAHVNRGNSWRKASSTTQRSTRLRPR